MGFPSAIGLDAASSAVTNGRARKGKSDIAQGFIARVLCSAPVPPTATKSEKGALA